MRGRSVRKSALDELGDRDAPTGSRLWALWVVTQAKMQRADLEFDASQLRDLLAQILKHEAWKALGVLSFDILCKTQLKLSADEADAVLQSKNGQSIGAVLRKPGRPKAGEGNGANGNISKGENHPAYLAARLRRDHPDAVFDESVRGSVRQAAIAAGIVKVPSVLDQMLKLWAKASQEHREEFLLRISK